MPAPAQDVVGVFDSSGNQLFQNARSIKAQVTPPARLMEQPLETSASIVDHMVFDPIQIQLSCILDSVDFADTYQQIFNTFKASAQCTVITKTSSYENMVIIGPPYDESPDMFDTIAVGIKLKEAVFVSAQYAPLPPNMVKKPSNSSTLKTGQKTPTAANAQQSSAAFSLLFGSK